MKGRQCKPCFVIHSCLFLFYNSYVSWIQFQILFPWKWRDVETYHREETYVPFSHPNSNDLCRALLAFSLLHEDNACNFHFYFCPIFHFETAPAQIHLFSVLQRYTHHIMCTLIENLLVWTSPSRPNFNHFLLLFLQLLTSIWITDAFQLFYALILILMLRPLLKERVFSFPFSGKERAYWLRPVWGPVIWSFLCGSIFNQSLGSHSNHWMCSWPLLYRQC